MKTLYIAEGIKVTASRRGRGLEVVSRFADDGFLRVGAVVGHVNALDVDGGHHAAIAAGVAAGALAWSSDAARALNRASGALWQPDVAPLRNPNASAVWADIAVTDRIRVLGGGICGAGAVYADGVAIAVSGLLSEHDEAEWDRWIQTARPSHLEAWMEWERSHGDISRWAGVPVGLTREACVLGVPNRVGVHQLVVSIAGGEDEVAVHVHADA